VKTFDDLSKSLATATTRRQAIALLGMGTAAAFLSAFRSPRSWARATGVGTMSCRTNADCSASGLTCCGDGYGGTYCGTGYDPKCRPPDDKRNEHKCANPYDPNCTGR
jgi:hypothetical protein